MKKAIRKILGYFGYDVIKVMPVSVFKKEFLVKVGEYNLIMPANNPLRKTYREQNDFATEITRLTAIVHEKYPDLIFLDVGANTGDTIARVKAVSDIPVISIEGDDISFGYLKKNIAQFSQVTIIKQFLGEKNGDISGELKKKGWNTTIIPSDSSAAKISIKTIDSVLSESLHDIRKIKIFKVDTEGFDTIILRGAQNFIRETKPVIYLEYNRDNMNAINENGLATILRLESVGYKRILFYDDRGRYILTTTLAERELVLSLHNYADGKNGLIYYYNICLFHDDDDDLALKIAEGETLYEQTHFTS